MNKVIKDIIDRNCSKEDKNKALNILSEEIEIAKGILSGKYIYCSECDDYYLAKSYFTEVESKESKICTYQDPINSGGNEYEDGYVDITYRICPKGHKHILSREERKKIRRA